MAFEFKFDKPLTFRWKFMLPELVSEIKASIRREFNTAGGDFTRSWKLSDMSVLPTKDGIQITSDHPGAAAQEFGAQIPERFPVNAQAMRWNGGGGEAIYAKRAKGFTLRGRGYIEKAVEAWAGQNVDVEWNDGKSG